MIINKMTDKEKDIHVAKASLLNAEKILEELKDSIRDIKSKISNYQRSINLKRDRILDVFVVIKQTKKELRELEKRK